MENDTQQSQDHTSLDFSMSSGSAVTDKKFRRSPLVNGIIAAIIILVVGFMTYNAIGHSLTQIADISSQHTVVALPTVVPSDTQLPSRAPSSFISPTQ